MMGIPNKIVGRIKTHSIFEVANIIFEKKQGTNKWKVLQLIR